MSDRIDLFESLALPVEIGTRVMVRSVQSFVA
jgi:hypothetical protein